MNFFSFTKLLVGKSWLHFLSQDGRNLSYHIIQITEPLYNSGIHADYNDYEIYMPVVSIVGDEIVTEEVCNTCCLM